MLVECLNCSAVVDGVEIAHYIDSEDESGTVGKYTFLKCPRCRSPLVMLQTDDGPGWESPQRIYPSEVEMGDLSIPIDISIAYSEARACFKCKTYTAAAIMCRKTLEGITEAHGIKSRNLAGALKEMRDKGIIENRLYEWADALRISGNEAAHGVGIVTSAQDAKDILEFTHALLEYVFTFRHKFEQWKKRRAPRGQQADPSPPPDEEFP